MGNRLPAPHLVIFAALVLLSSGCSRTEYLAQALIQIEIEAPANLEPDIPQIAQPEMPEIETAIDPMAGLFDPRSSTSGQDGTPASGDSNPQSSRTDPSALNDITSPEFQAQIQILRSNSLASEVRRRLSEDEEAAIIRPYGSGIPIDRILVSNRQIDPVGEAGLINVGFRHPDPELAKLVADTYAASFSDNHEKFVVDGKSERLSSRDRLAEMQQLKVEGILAEMKAIQQEYPNINFDDPTATEAPEAIARYRTLKFDLEMNQNWLRQISTKPVDKTDTPTVIITILQEASIVE